MIAYFDTSALIPLLVEEPSSSVCVRLWNDASRIVSSRLLYPEGCAALAKAERIRRLTEGQHDAAAATLGEVMAQIHHVELTASLATAAGGLARELGLRGYDAVHLASALSVADADFVFTTGDHGLARAARANSLAVARTS